MRVARVTGSMCWSTVSSASVQYCAGVPAELPTELRVRGKHMSRRRTNPVEDLVELAEQLPWWAGIVAALLSWMAMYGVASHALPAAAQAESSLTVAVPVLRGLATAGQYVLPAMFLAAAVFSAWLHYIIISN